MKQHTATSARFAILGSLLVLGCSAETGGSVEEFDIGTTEQPIQSFFVDPGGDGSGSAWADVLTGNSGDKFATLIWPLLNNVSGNCGVTFISKHYAITASHCVDATSANGNPTAFNYSQTGAGFTVKQIMTTTLSATQILQAAAVTGSWSTGWTISDPMTEANGYDVTEMTNCKVKWRCDSNHSTQNSPRTCPPLDVSPFNGINVDIALIHCSSRASTNYVTVNTGDPTSGDIVVNGFHEVLDLRYSATGGTNTPTGNWSNYGFYDGTKINNYHYKSGLNAQYLPVQFHSWFLGPNYQIREPYDEGGSNNERVWADVPICKGISGSGAFLNGTSTLLGPMVGSSTALGNRLCHEMQDSTNVPQNGKNSTYIKAVYARQIEQYPTASGGVVLGDR